MIGEIVGAGIAAGADLLGGWMNQDAAEDASKKDWKRQKEVLQNQIQWRTQDAVAAGLHPLVGAGISPSSGPAGTTVGDMGSAVSRMGNNLGRAAEAMLRPEDKIAAKAALLDLEQRQANIDLTRSQIAGAQKALLTQGSTPGVASRLDNNPLPPGAARSSKFGNIPTRNVMQGQAAEDYAGDILGSLIAGVGSLDDFARYNYNSPDVISSWLSEMGGNVGDYLNPGRAPAEYVDGYYGSY